MIHGELSAPPELAPGALRIFALGGLGEIGRNMTVFEFAGRLLIVDCGVLFPEDNQPGVDLILPDFEYVRDRLDDIEAIRSAAKQREKLLKYIKDNLSYEALALKHGVAVTSINRVVNRVIYDAVL